MASFGTDGIRGRWPDVLTPDAATRLGAALRGRYARVAVVRDTRASGAEVQAALLAGLGDHALICGVLPTPGLSALLATGVAEAGVAITASHNPWQDNGLKVLGPGGRKLDPDDEAALAEAMAWAAPAGVPAFPLELADAESRYLAAVRAVLPPGTWLDGARIVFDGAHGAAWRVGPTLLRALGAEVVPVGCAPDGRNINEGVGAVHPELAAVLVHEAEADCGIVVDGDGDRVVLIDRTGDVLDGDAVLLLLAPPVGRASFPADGVVGTVMSNVALEQALAERGLDFARAAVGDRNVAIEMAVRGWNLGGEPSGHVLLSDGLPTGDGLVTALRVLSGGLDLAERLGGWAPAPSASVSGRVAARPALEGLLEVELALERARSRGAARIVLRYSGTEPKLRVLVEAGTQDLADALAGALLGEVLAVVGVGGADSPPG